MPLIRRDYGGLEYAEGTYGYELYDIQISDTGSTHGGLIASPRMKTVTPSHALVATPRMASVGPAHGPVVPVRPRRY